MSMCYKFSSAMHILSKQDTDRTLRNVAFIKAFDTAEYNFPNYGLITSYIDFHLWKIVTAIIYFEYIGLYLIIFYNYTRQTAISPGEVQRN